MKKQIAEFIKTRDEAKDWMVDRRVITGFIVQFMSPKSTTATRRAMLDALGKILNFSEAEKFNLGMITSDKPKIS